MICAQKHKIKRKTTVADYGLDPAQFAREPEPDDAQTTAIAGTAAAPALTLPSIKLRGGIISGAVGGIVLKGLLGPLSGVVDDSTPLNVGEDELLLEQKRQRYRAEAQAVIEYAKALAQTIGGNGEDADDDDDDEAARRRLPAFPDNAASLPNPDSNETPPEGDDDEDSKPSNLDDQKTDPTEIRELDIKRQIHELTDELQQILDERGTSGPDGRPNPDYDDLRDVLENGPDEPVTTLKGFREDLADKLPGPKAPIVRDLKNLPDDAILTPNQIEHLDRNIDVVLFRTLVILATRGSAPSIVRLLTRDARFRFINQVPGAVERIKRVFRLLGLGKDLAKITFK